MLDKDQYNQDEYNDYYAQATADAEIKSSGEEGGGGGKKIVIILLLLILIGALGYFGWTSMNSGSTSEKSAKTAETTTETTKEVTSEPVTSSSTSTEKQVAQQVAQNIVSERDATKEMAPEDIANIVQMVMSQLNQKDKQSEQTETPATNSNDQEKDSQLMESLSSAKVDSLSSETIDSSSISKDDNNKQASKSSEDNTYNKIVVKSDSSGIDELSKLSNEISDVIGSEDETDSKDSTVSGYTQSITKEVETRQKEMRYIIVRKGDTLGKIAKRAYGNVMDFKKIYKANPELLRRPDRIYIGQKLRIP